MQTAESKRRTVQVSEQQGLNLNFTLQYVVSVYSLSLFALSVVI